MIDQDRLIQTGPNSWTLKPEKKPVTKAGEEAKVYLTVHDTVRIVNILRDIEDCVRDLPVRASKKDIDDVVGLVRKKSNDIRKLLEPEDE